MTDFDRLLQASGMGELSKSGFTCLWTLICASPRPAASLLREELILLKDVFHIVLDKGKRYKSVIKTLKQELDQHEEAIAEVVAICQQLDCSNEFSKVFGPNNYFTTRGAAGMSETTRRRYRQVQQCFNQTRLLNGERRHSTISSKDSRDVELVINALREDLQGGQDFFKQWNVFGEIEALREAIEKEMNITTELLHLQNLNNFKSHRFAFQRHGIADYDPSQHYRNQVDAVKSKVQSLGLLNA